MTSHTSILSYTWSDSNFTFSLDALNAVYHLYPDAHDIGTPANGEAALAANAMNAWAAVANIQFTVDNSNPEIGFYEAAITHPDGVPLGVTYGFDAIFGTRLTDIDIFINSNGAAYIEPNEKQFSYVHELGHALGLQHPNGSGLEAPYTTNLTVMSYNYSNGFALPTGPMVYDIQAIQSMYGVNAGHNSGATTYTLDGSSKTWTIWDAGNTDEIKVAVDDTRDAVIDLRGGVNDEDTPNWSQIGDEHVAIAYGAHIENAHGGGGNDIIHGSDQFAATVVGAASYAASDGANQLYGNDGDDHIFGHEGNDTLEGGKGDDILEGGDGNDVYVMRHGHDGTDEITDSDGSGTVQINGLALSGDAIFNEGSSSWTMGHYILTRTGTADADMTFTSGFSGDPSFVIKNFNDGDFGISLTQPNQIAANPSAPSGGTGTYIGGGDDIYVGTSGDDTISAGGTSSSPASVYGDSGNDHLYLVEGTLFGGAGDDSIVGLQTAAAFGGDGNDGISHAGYADGGAGDDSIYYTGNWAPVPGTTYVALGGSGNDIITALTDSSSLYISGTIQGGSGNDYIYASGYYSSHVNYSISGGDDADVIGADGVGHLIYGDGGDDYITATDVSSSYISGGDGNDTIHAAWGSNTVTGGAGFDTYYASGNVDVSSESEGSRVFAGANSTVTGGTGNDILITNSGSGAELYSGGGGNDYISASSGNDSISGGAGQDSILGGADNDSINGDAGDDIVYGDAGNDYIDGGNDHDKLFGGTGLDTIWGSSGDDAIDGGDDNDSLIGGSGLDTLEGGVGADSLYGGDDADSISGGTGGDYIEAGAGDDFIIGGAGSDYIDGGANVDTVSYANSSAWVNVDLANNNHWNGDAAWDNIVNVENIVGSAFGDNLVGTNGANGLTGGSGNDSIYGLNDNDSIFGGTGDDYIEGGDGNDLIVGGAGSDYIDGGSGVDTVSYADSSAWVNVDLGGNSHWNGDAAWDNIVNVENIIGSNFSDQLTGSSAVNTIIGGAGNDVLAGGAANDTFYFGSGHGQDVISDFQGVGAASGDIIQIAGGSFGALSFAQNGSDAVITTATGTITLIGVSAASITVDDFSFAA